MTVPSGVPEAGDPSTPPSAAADYLRDALDSNIASFRLRRKRNRQLAFIAKISVALLGAITTILAGLQSNNIFSGVADWLAAFALITSASVAVFTAWEAFFDHRWLWITYTATLSELNGIKSDLEYVIARDGLAKSSDLDALYERRKVALQQTNRQWSNRRSSEKIAGVEGRPEAG